MEATGPYTVELLESSCKGTALEGKGKYIAPYMNEAYQAGAEWRRKGKALDSIDWLLMDVGTTGRDVIKETLYHCYKAGYDEAAGPDSAPPMDIPPLQDR